MPDQTLLFLTNDVRAKTLKLLSGLSEAEARFTPPGLVNSRLWHAGHSLTVVEHVSVSPATGKPPTYPAGWFDKFSWKSQPATVTEWPTVAEVVNALRDQQQRLTAVIGTLSDAQLDAILDPARGRTLRWSIMHGLHDESNHQGEMWLLKKLYEKQQAAGAKA